MRDAAGQEREDVIKRHGELEIDEDLRMQKGLHRAQRFFRSTAVALLVLAACGLFGEGPLSKASIPIGSGTLKYERIAYRDTPQTVRVLLPPGASKAGIVRLFIDNRALNRMSNFAAQPPPISSVLSAGRAVYEFKAGADDKLEVVLSFQQQSAGYRKIRLGVEGGPSSGFSQFVLP